MNARNVLIALLVLILSSFVTSANARDDNYRNDNGYRNDSGYRDDNGYRNDRRHSRHYRCNYCGEITRIDRYRGDRRGSGAGAVAGAIVGGLLGNQVGKGDGRRAATVAGAVAGGFAGNSIERHSDRTYYDITVRLDTGRRVVVTQTRLNGFRRGSRVLVRDGYLQHL